MSYKQTSKVSRFCCAAFLVSRHCSSNRRGQFDYRKKDSWHDKRSESVQAAASRNDRWHLHAPRDLPYAPVVSGSRSLAATYRCYSLLPVVVRENNARTNNVNGSGFEKWQRMTSWMSHLGRRLLTALRSCKKCRSLSDPFRK